MVNHAGNVSDAILRAVHYHRQNSNASMLDLINFEKYFAFDTSLQANTQNAGFQVNGYDVFYGRSQFPAFEIVNPEELNDYVFTVTEVESTSGQNPNFMLGYKPQPEIETIIKNGLSVSSLYKRPYYYDGTKTIPINWGVPISKNYEQVLLLLNFTRYRKLRLPTSEFTATWEKFSDFTSYNSNGDIINSGVRVPMGSGIGVGADSAKTINKANGYLSSEYTTYCDLTITPSPDTLTDKVYLVYHRSENTLTSQPKFFEESQVYEFDISNGAVTKEIRVQAPIVDLGTDDIFTQSMQYQRGVSEKTTFSDLEDMLSKMGVS